MSESPLTGKRVAVIGCGNMASAIVGGLIDRGLAEPAQITGADKDEARAGALAQRTGIAIAPANTQAVAGAALVLLAVKPQNALDVLAEIGTALAADQLVLSIMAGITTGFLESRIAAPCPVVRAMPNTPALVGCGATALAAGAHAGDEHLTLARTIFDAVGITVELAESDLDAVTGLSGSGPGYVYYFIEAMIQAGMDVGLSPRVSRQLVAQTFLGAARLLVEDAERRTPGELREAVTSPGGTTAAGLDVLRQNDIAAVIRRAVRAATERSRELGNR